MMLNYILSIILAPLLAIIVIAIVWIKRDKNRYPGLITSFAFGGMSIILVLIFQYIARKFGLEDFKNLRRIIFYSFIVMGFGSEFGKFLILRYFNYSKKSFNGPLDAIVYSVMISMGFSFTSNIIYLLMYSEIDFLYAITMVFANLFFAVILGFFVGMAKTRENKFVDAMTGLFAASFFHALYNFCFIPGHEDFRLLLFLTIGAFVVVIMLYYKAFELNEEYKRIRRE